MTSLVKHRNGATDLMKPMFRNFDDIFNWNMDSVFGESLAGMSDSFFAYEEDGYLYVEVDVPGFEKSDLKVTVKNGRLNIHGSRTGTRSRTINKTKSLNTEQLDLSSIKSKLNMGVLTISIPLKNRDPGEESIEVDIE